MKQFMLLVVLVLLAGMAYGQSTNQTDLRWAATVAQTPLEIAIGDEALYDNLRPGIAYKTIADGLVNYTNITPMNEGNPEEFTPGSFEVIGDPNVEVSLTFVLPYRLYPMALGTGWVDMSYDNTSASFFDQQQTNHFFNPENGCTVLLPGDGSSAYFFYGGNPTVSPNASLDEYEGFGFVIADYTGVAQ